MRMGRGEERRWEGREAAEERLLVFFCVSWPEVLALHLQE